MLYLQSYNLVRDIFTADLILTCRGCFFILFSSSFFLCGQNVVLSASEAQGEGVFLEVIMTLQAEEGLQTSSPESLGFAGS